jgi:predicted permease
MKNLKLAFRVLARTPFVSSVAILSLGLGLGANAAIFSLYSQLILKKLDVPEPAQLVNLATPGPKSGSNSCGMAGPCTAVMSYPMFRDLERQQTSFTGIAAHRNVAVNLSYKNTPLRATGLEVSGSYFRVLGLTPAAGRLLGDADDRTPGDSPVVVLSYRFWQTHLGGSANVVNDTIIVNGQPMTVVGIAPEDFDGTTIGNRAQVFLPITLAETLQPGRKVFDNRRSYWVYAFARLKPGVTMAQAETAINQPYHAIINDVEVPLQKGMSAPTLDRFKAKRVELSAGSAGQSNIPNQAMAPLLLLLGVTVVVLLTACANIANLLLAKAVGRASEMAVRLSIGASRAQLIGQLLGESVLLAVCGGLLGLLLGKLTLTYLFSMMPEFIAGSMTPALDRNALLFLGAATLGTGVLFGLFPALHSSRPNLVTSLKSQAGQPGGSKSAKRFRTALATTQITLSMALLAVAGLFVKSIVNIHHVDLGMRTAHVVTFELSPGLNGYTPERSQRLLETVEDELARIPGVTHASGNIVGMLQGDNWANSLRVEGFQAAPDTNTNSSVNEVAPGYFATLGIPLLAGRDFTRTDTLTMPKVAVVNQTFAAKFNLLPNPIGKHFGVGGNTDALDIEIVGFAKDAKYNEVKGEIPPQYFMPYRQDERADSLVFYVLAPGSERAVLGAIRPMMTRLDAMLPVESLALMDDQVLENVFEDRLMSTVAGAFAVLATILAAIGLFGVVAYSVAQRTREIGLRMALGADPVTIRTMVLRSVMWMTVIGGAIGLALALGAGWLVRAQLFGMTSFDPMVIVTVIVLLSLVAFGAGLIPARRAARVDPMRALRYE